MEKLTGNRPWFSKNVDWTAVDDRVRGGSSRSYLDPIENSTYIRFAGTLDTTTLGGAGFASQSTRSDRAWDLSDFDGIQLAVVKADNKTYTFIVKDDVPDSKRDDGREKSSINWEYDFKITNETSTESSNYMITIPWTMFKATYRGRERKDTAPLKTSKIERFSLMMRRQALSPPPKK